MTVWVTIWVVLMMFWLFGYGMWHYSVKTGSAAEFGLNCLIPWMAVLILGLVVFGAVGGGTLR